MKKIIVVGSLNKDLVSFCTRYPNIGETVKGTDYKEFNGGKGGNQAVALANLGSDVLMVAKVGEDSFGSSLIESLNGNHIDTSYVFKTNKINTGIATILVDNNTKDNAIVVTAGSNNLLNKDDINKIESVLKDVSFLVTQFEVPFETVLHAFKLAKKHNIKTVLNPSPMVDNVADIFSYCDYLIINKTELEEITKTPITSKENLKEQAKDLYEQYNLETIIITLGSDGVIAYNTEENFLEESAFKVQAKDTTGAGDTFAGAIVSKINQGESLSQALSFATGASALAVSKEGAQNSIPTTQEVDEFLKNNTK